MTAEVKVLNPADGVATQDAIIYPNRADGTVGGSTLNFSSSASVWDHFGGAGTATFGIEGRKHGKEVVVRVTFKINGATIGKDEIRVLVAPWMALSNARPVPQIHSGFGDETTFTADMNALFGSANNQ